jgi:hypothetical protein
MGFSETNRAFLQISREATPGVLPGSPRVVPLGWNSISGWGPKTEMTQSDEVSPTNQVEPGQAVDKLANGSVTCDMNLGRVLELADMALHATWYGLAPILPTAVASATAITVPAMAAALAAGTLIKVRGCVNAANNGLKEVDAGATTTSIPIVGGGMVVEAGLAARFVTIEVCGFRFPVTDLQVTVSGSVTSLVSAATNLSTIFAGAPLLPGMGIFVGGPDGSMTNTNRFAQAANRGPARILSASATTWVIENTTQAFVADPGTAKRIDIFWGREARIVYLTDARYADHTASVEVTDHKLGAGDVPAYSMTTGAALQSLQLAMPEKTKATITGNFVALDAAAPNAVRTTGFSTPVALYQNMLVNTTTNIKRGRIRKLNGNALRTGYITAATFNFDSVTERNGAHGVMGAVKITQGKVMVKLDVNAHFTIPEVIDDLVNCELMGADWFIANNDGGLMIDIPQCQLSDGEKEYPPNQTVRITLAVGASRDPVFGTSAIITHFPHIPLGATQLA